MPPQIPTLQLHRIFVSRGGGLTRKHAHVAAATCANLNLTSVKAYDVLVCTLYIAMHGHAS